MLATKSNKQHIPSYIKNPQSYTAQSTLYTHQTHLQFKLSLLIQDTQPLRQCRHPKNIPQVVKHIQQPTKLAKFRRRFPPANPTKTNQSVNQKTPHYARKHHKPGGQPANPKFKPSTQQVNHKVRNFNYHTTSPVSIQKFTTLHHTNSKLHNLATYHANLILATAHIYAQTKPHEWLPAPLQHHKTKRIGNLKSYCQQPSKSSVRGTHKPTHIILRKATQTMQHFPKSQTPRNPVPTKPQTPNSTAQTNPLRIHTHTLQSRNTCTSTGHSRTNQHSPHHYNGNKCRQHTKPMQPPNLHANPTIPPANQTLPDRKTVHLALKNTWKLAFNNIFTKKDPAQHKSPNIHPTKKRQNAVNSQPLSSIRPPLSNATTNLPKPK
eukprot:gene2982-1964_t